MKKNFNIYTLFRNTELLKYNTEVYFEKDELDFFSQDFKSLDDLFFKVNYNKYNKDFTNHMFVLFLCNYFDLNMLEDEYVQLFFTECPTILIYYVLEMSSSLGIDVYENKESYLSCLKNRNLKNEKKLISDILFLISVPICKKENIENLEGLFSIFNSYTTNYSKVSLIMQWGVIVSGSSNAFKNRFLRVENLDYSLNDLKEITNSKAMDEHIICNLQTNYGEFPQYLNELILKLCYVHNKHTCFVFYTEKDLVKTVESLVNLKSEEKLFEREDTVISFMMKRILEGLNEIRISYFENQRLIRLIESARDSSKTFNNLLVTLIKPFPTHLFVANRQLKLYLNGLKEV